jgi:ribosomal protein S18 acetylase RimI-like enzyme
MEADDPVPAIGDRIYIREITMRGCERMTTIRKLGPEDDLGDLVALSRAFFREYEAHHKDFFLIDELHDRDITGYFTRSVEADDGATFIAVLGDKVVGYITIFVRAQASFYRVKKVGAISGLMVQADHRRQGLASRLYRKAMAFFAERGVAYSTVYTATANRAAVKFYERVGMTPLHIRMIGETGGGSEGIA